MTRFIPTLALAGVAAMALGGATIAQTTMPVNPPASTNSPNSPNAQRSDTPDTRAPGSTTAPRSDNAPMQTQGSSGAQRQSPTNVAAQPYAWRSIDARMLGEGRRSSKFVGSSVVNDANETVGTIDDLIIMSGDKAPYAVISVGGFLGMGSRYVVVPYSALQMRDKQVLLRGATKDSLKGLTEYKYPT